MRTTSSHFTLSCLALLSALSWLPVRAAGEELPVSVDLRPQFDQWGLDRWQQGVRPTCSVFTVAGALEYAVAARQGRGERLSVEFLNWSANQERRPRDGGFFSDMWKGFEKHGICAESQMPYEKDFDPLRAPLPEAVTNAGAKQALGLELHWIKKWNVKTGLTEEEFQRIRRTLGQKWPVCGGFRWPKQEQWTNGRLQMCEPEAVFDGHSVLLVGFRDEAELPGGGVFIFRNTNHGGRDGFMPYAYARAYMNDALWISSEKPDPTAP